MGYRLNMSHHHYKYLTLDTPPGTTIAPSGKLAHFELWVTSIEDAVYVLTSGEHRMTWLGYTLNQIHPDNSYTQFRLHILWRGKVYDIVTLFYTHHRHRLEEHLKESEWVIIDE